MSIEYYGSEPSINIESADELYEALDLLHTQVMDNLREEKTLLNILSEAMDRVQAFIDAQPEQ